MYNPSWSLDVSEGLLLGDYDCAKLWFILTESLDYLFDRGIARRGKIFCRRCNKVVQMTIELNCPVFASA
jgi:hypothetical protein